MRLWTWKVGRLAWAPLTGCGIYVSRADGGEMWRRVWRGLHWRVRMFCLPLLAALLLTGCVSLSVPLPDGRMARYTRVGSTSLEGLVVKHGNTTVEVRGYQSEGASLAEGIARGVATGLSEGALP